MNGSELLVPHIIAERHLEARQHGLARLARAGRQRRPLPVEQDRNLDWTSERYRPILRGYPADLFFADRSR